MEIKQVIVVRKDLKMRRGKEIAQGAHASMAAVLKDLDNKHVKKWLEGSFTKIVVTVNSEEELLEVYKNACDKKIPCALIRDAGRTEFNGVPTLTTVAVGPAPADIVNKVTGDLKLY